MNMTLRSGGLRWTLLSFAAIALTVWVTTALLFTSATPAVDDLMSDLSVVLDSGADTLNESAGAVQDGAVLIRDVEPGLRATTRGLDSSANSLRSTQDAVLEISSLFKELGASLTVAGDALSSEPSLVEAGQALTDAGSSMTEIGRELDSIPTDLDELIAELDILKQTVDKTADNTTPLTVSLDRTQSSLEETGGALRSAAMQIDAVRNSASLRLGIIFALVLLGTISISLAVIAASRLTQLGLIKQAAETAASLPSTAKRVSGTIERNLNRERLDLKDRS